MWQHLYEDIDGFLNSEELSFENFKNFYWKGWEKIREYFYREKEGEPVLKILTYFTDYFIKRLYELALDEYHKKYPRTEGEFAVIAVGGYGRGELNPFSDIDLLFLVPYKVTPYVESVGEKVYYTLWDTGLLVGYSFRNFGECERLGLKDSTIRTAMLDHRFLFGSKEVYETFVNRVAKKLTYSSVKPFVKGKLKEQEERRSKFGGTLFLLEPDVKNGEGGLRDIHTAWWIGKVKYKIRRWEELYQKGVIPIELIQQMKEAREFIWKIRNFLHFTTKYKTDHFALHLQNDAALFFGYIDDEKMYASERLMKDYYKNASIIREFSDYIVKKSSEELQSRIFVPKRKIIEGFVIVRDFIHIPGERFLLEDQKRFLKAFNFLQEFDLRFDLDSLYLLKQKSQFINDSLRTDREAGEIFMRILDSDKKIFETVKLMHDVKVLDNFIPEFAHLFGLIQHDVYHIYTADVHSLFAVRELEKLFREDPESEIEKEYRGVLESVPDSSLLFFITLLHDIGKGLGGKHEEKGASMVKTIGKRIGLEEEKVERASLIVKEHLTLTNFALRRDINDKNLIKELTKRVKDTENLSYLLLLSYADLKSVRPDEYTEWKLTLMFELYRRALFMIESGDVEGRWLKKWASERIEKGIESFPPQKKKKLLPLMEEFPRRFFIANEPPLIKLIFENLHDISTEGVKILTGDTTIPDVRSVIILAGNRFNRKGLFADLTGVLRAFNCNIVEAQIYTLARGTIVDMFHVYMPPELWTPRRIESLKETLAMVLRKELEAEDIVKKRQTGLFYKKIQKVKVKYPARITVDNFSSKHFTLIEIVALDMPGLLYRITKSFSMHDLDINYARISSFGPRIADIFYLRTEKGKKITDKNMLEKIISNVSEVLIENEYLVEING